MVILDYPEKILVSIWPGLGDILFITPALRILRKKFPKSWITVFSLWDGPGKSLLELNPNINQLIYSTPREALKLARQFSKQRFDIGLEMSFPIRWFFKLAKVRRSISFARRPFWWIFPYGDKQDSQLHASEQYLKAVDKIDGVKLRDNRGYDLYLSSDDRSYADDVLSETGNDLTVIVHPGARCNKNKRWSIDKVVTLCRRIIDQYSANIITIGDKEDAGNGMVIQQNLGNKVINLIGKSSLRQTAAVMEKGDLFIGNDSGPTHIASTFIPVVAVFASSNPNNFRPYSHRSIVVTPHCRCSPCFHFPGYMNLIWGLRLRFINYCPAMDTITVDDVFQAVEKSLIQ
ncbi:MAG: hypothetical protein APR63_06065 [Desulfuromonas sp. SDB]|nr:MAG: hypothetical protein APR63_06065 [Desulfuromonas sp. SDB]